MAGLSPRHTTCSTLQPYFFDPADSTPPSSRRQIDSTCIDISQGDNQEGPAEPHEHQTVETLEAAHVLLSLYHNDPINRRTPSRAQTGPASTPTHRAQYTAKDGGDCNSTLRTSPNQSRNYERWMPGGRTQPLNTTTRRQYHVDQSLSPTKVALLKNGSYTAAISDDAHYFHHPILLAIHSSPARHQGGDHIESIGEIDVSSDTTELVSDGEDLGEGLRGLSAPRDDKFSATTVQYHLPTPPILMHSRRGPTDRLPQHDDLLPAASPTKRGPQGRDRVDSTRTGYLGSSEQERQLVPDLVLSAEQSATHLNGIPSTPPRLPLDLAPESTTSLDAFMLEARQAMCHRRTDSLDSYLARARQSFDDIKADEDQMDVMDEMSFVGDSKEVNLFQW